MPTIASSNIPAPSSWDEFEEIMLDAAKIRWRSSNFYRNGRQGQLQHGVDIFGTAKSGTRLGVQCKNTVKRLTEALVKAEISNAERFKPPLSALYIATTALRDAELQMKVRAISDRRRAARKFTVAILFWTDVAQDLAADERVFFKHYPQFLSRSSPIKDHDRKLYRDFLQLLPSDGVVAFADRSNMAGFSFVDSKLDPLRTFYYTWIGADREFISPELESLRQKLWRKSGDYLQMIALETFSVDGERQAVPEEWEYEQPERFQRVIRTLHSLAGEIVDLHRKLVRAGRDYLASKI